jgi:uncharacterized protein DUF4411
MDWQARYYPLDLFPRLSTKIGELITADQFKAVDLVREEIDAVAPPGLKTWAATSKIFVPLVPEIQAEGAAIEALYPDLGDPNGIYQSADVYLIAHAKLESGIVLSQETSAHEKPNAKKKHFIPDVCRDLGVPCINLLGLMRRRSGASNR